MDELDKLYSRQINLLKEYLNFSADSASNKTPEARKLILISFIMIFIAHATITDATN